MFNIVVGNTILLIVLGLFTKHFNQKQSNSILRYSLILNSLVFIVFSTLFFNDNATELFYIPQPQFIPSLYYPIGIISIAIVVLILNIKVLKVKYSFAILAAVFGIAFFMAFNFAVSTYFHDSLTKYYHYNEGYKLSGIIAYNKRKNDNIIIANTLCSQGILITANDIKTGFTADYKNEDSYRWNNEVVVYLIRHNGQDKYIVYDWGSNTVTCIMTSDEVIDNCILYLDNITGKDLKIDKSSTPIIQARDIDVRLNDKSYNVEIIPKDGKICLTRG